MARQGLDGNYGGKLSKRPKWLGGDGGRLGGRLASGSAKGDLADRLRFRALRGFGLKCKFQTQHFIGLNVNCSRLGFLFSTA